MSYQPYWLKWLKWYHNDLNDFRNDLIDVKNDNNGLNSEQIIKKANALRKCVTQMHYQPYWLKWHKWCHNDSNDFRNDLIDLKKIITT